MRPGLWGRDDTGSAGWPAYPLMCVTVLASLAASTTAGVLPPVIAIVLTLVAVGCAAAGPAQPVARKGRSAAGTAGRTRAAGSTGLLVFVLAGAVLLARDGDAVGALSIVASGLLCAQLLRVDGTRAAALTLALAVVSAVFAPTRSQSLVPAVAVTLCLVAALGSVHALHLLRQRAQAGVVADTGNSVVSPARLVRLLAVTAVTAAVVVLVIPLHPPSGGGGSLAKALAQRSGDTTDRSATSFTNGILDMRARGHLPTYPVVEVPGDSPVYWRGATLTTYVDGQWFGAERDEPADAGSGDRPQRTDRVLALQGFDGVLLAPGTPLSVQGARPMSSGTALLLRDGSGGVPQEYTVTSRSADAGAVTAAEPSSAEHGADLTLPPTVPERVRALGRSLVEPASSVDEAVRSVRTYLDDNATYDLDSPVPAPGVDPVEDFLFVSHRGFCEQFAAAAVVLLRSGGVPARMVTGFASTGPVADGRRTVRADEAHAWIDVWVPGQGWSQADPTPPGSAGRVRAAPVERLRAWLRDHSHRVALAVGLVVLTLAAAGGVALWRRRQPVRADVGPDRTEPLRESTLALNRLEHALAQAGRARAPSETLTELSGRLELSGERAWALACFERERYGRRTPSSADRHRAITIVDDLTASLLVEVRAREVTAPG